MSSCAVFTMHVSCFDEFFFQNPSEKFQDLWRKMRVEHLTFLKSHKKKELINEKDRNQPLMNVNAQTVP